MFSSAQKNIRKFFPSLILNNFYYKKISKSKDNFIIYSSKLYGSEIFFEKMKMFSKLPFSNKVNITSNSNFFSHFPKFSTEKNEISLKNDNNDGKNNNNYNNMQKLNNNKSINVKKEKKIVAVGISGGVDSAVSALLLKNQGYEIIGIFMQNWDKNDEIGSSFCSLDEDLMDAKKVCLHLDIPLKIVNFSRQYWLHVFENFISEYELGLTPNPDLYCNKYIKFDSLLHYALSLGAHYLATGHYAILEREKNGRNVKLLKGKDKEKDQTYFLASVNQNALHKVLFPIGHMSKPEVRQLAVSQKLPNADKRSSAGICFVGRRRFENFLSQYVQAQSGSFVDVCSTQTMGEHSGLSNYTFGQRAKISGLAEPWFVVGKHFEKKIVFIAPGPDHPALFCQSAVIDSLFWIAGYPPHALREGKVLKCQFKARYGPNVEDCFVCFSNADSVNAKKLKMGIYAQESPEFLPSKFCLLPKKEGNESVLHAWFPKPAKAITPRQAFVLYENEICLGGGLIVFPGPNLFEKNQIQKSQLQKNPLQKNPLRKIQLQKSQFRKIQESQITNSQSAFKNFNAKNFLPIWIRDQNFFHLINSNYSKYSKLSFLESSNEKTKSFENLGAKIEISIFRNIFKLQNFFFLGSTSKQWEKKKLFTRFPFFEKKIFSNAFSNGDIDDGECDYKMMLRKNHGEYGVEDEDDEDEDENEDDDDESYVDHDSYDDDYDDSHECRYDAQGYEKDKKDVLDENKFNPYDKNEDENEEILPMFLSKRRKESNFRSSPPVSKPSIHHPWRNPPLPSNSNDYSQENYGLLFPKDTEQIKPNPFRKCTKNFAPVSKLIDKFTIMGFSKRNPKANTKAMRVAQPTSLRKLTMWTHNDILRFYNKFAINIYEYYSHVQNYNELLSVIHILKLSCALTLALKCKLRTKRKVFLKFGKDLGCPQTGARFFKPKPRPRVRYVQGNGIEFHRFSHVKC